MARRLIEAFQLEDELDVMTSSLDAEVETAMADVRDLIPSTAYETDDLDD